MTTTPAVKNQSAALRFAVIPLILISSISLPILAVIVNAILPRALSSNSLIGLLFFAPQYLFAFGQMVRPVSGGYERFFSPAGSWIFSITLWAVIAAIFGVSTKGPSIGKLIILAFVVVMFVAVATHATFSIFGYSLELDGP